MMSKASYLKKWWTAGSKLLLLAALALPMGCDTPQEQPEPGGPTHPFTLTATLEQPTDAPLTKQDPATKTSLGALSEGTRPVLWSSGDEIWVMSGSELNMGTVMSTTSTGTDASFTKEFDHESNPDTSTPYYAFYPYPRAIMFESSNQNFTVSLNDQNYVANSFGVNAAPMTAYNSGSSASMAFKNVYGLLKLNLTGAIDVKVYNIRVTSNAGEFLSGRATINHNGGTPTVTFDASMGSPSVMLNCVTTATPNGVSLSATDTPFYIALPPTVSTTDYGYKVEVFTNKGTMTKTMSRTDARHKIERSKILSMQSIPFSADPANCYVVAPGTTGFTFIANVKGNSTETIATQSVGVLWETGTASGGVVSSASYSTETKLATITTVGEGSAVIAAYDASNSIIWSWHIWVTNFIPNLPANQRVYSLTGVTMMDRNLGALSNAESSENTDVRDFGHLYQWGRKDPFIGAKTSTSTGDDFAATTGSWGNTAVTTAVGGGSDALAYSIAHPMYFIYSDQDLLFDWYGTASHNNNLWNASKTCYDPCPSGWRVPDGGFEIGSADPVPWYPPTGLRTAIGRGLNLVGGNTRNYWSCTPAPAAADKAYQFNGNGQMVRAYGLSVRCQKM